MPGDSTTVCNMQPDAAYNVYLGASYRMVAELAESELGLWAISVPGQSGHPGSPHYGNQEKAWVDGNYHHLSLATRAAEESNTLLKLTPRA
jgi:penicillin amidase